MDTFRLDLFLAARHWKALRHIRGRKICFLCNSVFVREPF